MPAVQFDWFATLTGFPEESYESTRSQLVVEGDELVSTANGARYGIGELSLGCELSAELRSHTGAFLRRLASINPDVRLDEPLHIRALPNTKPKARQVNATPEVCPMCNLAHAGECD
jgi:hypothetical protein